MITKYYSKYDDNDGTNTKFNRKMKITDFLKLEDLTGHRVTEKQNSIFTKLRDGIELIRNCLEKPKNLEHNTDELQQIFNSKSLYPIIHNLIQNANEDNLNGSEYLYDIRRMEIVRMLFDEIKDYLDKSPMFENDLEIRERLYQMSLKLKDTSKIILKKENIIQEQIKLKLSDEIRTRNIEKIKKLKPDDLEKQIKDIEKKAIPKEIMENKLLQLFSDLELIDIDKTNDSVYGFHNKTENRIKSLYLDLYIIDTEHDELKNNQEPKTLIKKNREKKKSILKEIKMVRDKQKSVDNMIKNVALTEKKFNDKLENIESYFSPLNPINKLQFILENHQGMSK